MKHVFGKWISVAAISLVVMGGAPAWTQNAGGSETTLQTDNPQRTANQPEANGMVPGVVALVHTLDAGSSRPGVQFQTKLESTVHLANGTELPRGSVIIGQVASDDMSQSGTSKLALRFTEAKTKDGKTIPVHATIVEVYPPREFNGYGSPNVDANSPNTGQSEWNARTLKVDQIGAVNGVDLHSNVTSQNSGVLVSTKLNDVKLHQGTQLALAIRTESNGNQPLTVVGTSR